MILWLSIVVVILAGFFGYSLLTRKKEKVSQLQKPDFEKDKVYLVQFPVSPSIRSISPFALKLETYLRLKNINYEPVYSLQFSKKGQIPYIELNGEAFADSNLIIKELEKRGICKPDDEEEQQKAINHLVTTTLENHTSIVGFYWRYSFNMEEFCSKLITKPNTYPKNTFFFRKILPITMRLRAFLQGIGRHSLEEVCEFSFEDLKAISNLLKDQKFFNGGDNPSTIDCTLFGHLVQFVFMPMDIPQKEYINRHCPNLEAFVHRMKNKFWTDWEAQTHSGCMDNKRAKSLK